jgi:negative regulator of sigma E activity
MTKMLSKLTGDLATKADLDNAMRDFLREMKLWIGGALIVTVAAVVTIVALVVNVSTLTGSP